MHIVQGKRLIRYWRQRKAQQQQQQFIYKLRRAGINELLLDWLSDYLKIIVDKDLSFQGEHRISRAGVPQE